mmetsp:Transcript_32121/g.88027  ORF Transcript_32121/g.88027 Transcript_32121/m.88027 type:complete len:208 (+) Transcript_32121:444-1067(+)
MAKARKEGVAVRVEQPVHLACRRGPAVDGVQRRAARAVLPRTHVAAAAAVATARGVAEGPRRVFDREEALHAPAHKRDVREDHERARERQQREGAREHGEKQRGDAAGELARRVELQRDELPDAFARPLHEKEGDVEALEGRVRPQQLVEEEEQEERVSERQRQLREVLAERVRQDGVVARLAPEDGALRPKHVEVDLDRDDGEGEQ